jgi:hypothetical protein
MVEEWFPVDTEPYAYLFEQVDQLLGMDIQRIESFVLRESE